MKGHVRKRGKKWVFVIDIGKDENGKRKQYWSRGFEKQREAEKAMNAMLHELNTGAYVAPSQDSFGEYITAWLEDKRSKIRPNTFRSYEGPVRLYIVPALGKYKLTDLRPHHLRQFYRDLQNRDRPLSSRTIQLCHTLIREALKQAVKDELVPRNIAEAVNPPRLEQQHGNTWTPEQVVRFLEANKDEDRQYYVGFVLAIMTGMRKSEILALRWSDIDFEESVLHVNRMLTWVKGEPIFQEPKSRRSRRAIALGPETVRELERHREFQVRDRNLYGPEYQDHDLVVARPDGRPMYPRTFDDAWYRALKRANVPKIRFHDLRHTHASLLLKQEVHPQIVRERLGHSTITITLDIYSHLLPGMQRKVANQFEDLLRDDLQT